MSKSQKIAVNGGPGTNGRACVDKKICVCSVPFYYGMSVFSLLCVVVLPSLVALRV